MPTFQTIVKYRKNRTLIQRGIAILLLIIFYLFLYKLYTPRINAFGCFDDCFNIMGGYFILQGKELYSEIFFNHQMGMAFMSALVQLLTDPQSIPELILEHRQTVLLLSFGLNILLLFRFGLYSFFFIILYELTKFYVFGDRFLAEGIVVYLLAYLLGIVWEKIFYKKERKIDLILLPLFTWAVFILREPFAPVAFILFAVYIFSKPFLKFSTIAVSSFILIFLILIPFIFIDFGEFFFNVITVNQMTILKSEDIPLLTRLFRMFLYPVYLITSPEPWTFFRTITASISFIFILQITLMILKYKKIKEVLFVIFILGISNLRPSGASQEFYQSFHIAPWFGLIIFSSAFMMRVLSNQTAKHLFTFSALIGVLLLYIVLNNNYFMHERVDSHTEFFNNYGPVMESGTVIRDLSDTSDSLFLDGYDDLIYWEAKRKSPYQFTWYTSVMPLIPRYLQARDEMYQTNPPDFVYGNCVYENNEVLKNKVDNYFQFYFGQKKNCIFIRKEKYQELRKNENERLKQIESRTLEFKNPDK